MKKQKKIPALRRRITAGIFIIIGLALVAALGVGFALSRVTYVERVTLLLADLPEQLAGTTILYISDVDMVGLSGPRGTAALFDKLEQLHPDILLLGGDYANPSLMDRINGEADDEVLAGKRRSLFSALADFEAPLGKYAVAGEHDGNALAEELALGGIRLIKDETVDISAGGVRLILAGLGAYSGGLSGASQQASALRSDDCVIAAAHNPATVSSILTSEAADGGPWADVVLTGHTHGGQVTLNGRSMLKLTENETRYPTGWSKESGTFVLVSQGLGCEGLNMRLGTHSTVHLITLRRAQAAFQFEPQN